MVISAALRKDLAKQDCASPSSSTWPIARPVDPFHSIRSAAGRHLEQGNPQLARMLEWAYGYRPGTGAGRRAPSAGALYPCELITVELAAAGWRCFLYDFRRRQRVWLAAADGAALARLLRLGPRQAAIVAVAALWRTVQRYGARGYRYCALDAGHVLGNLCRVADLTGGQLSWHSPAAPAVSALLTLPDSTVALAVGVLGLPGVDVACPPATAAVRPVGQAGAGDGASSPEETPLASPQLLRVRRFHEKVGACAGRPVEPPPTVATADLYLALDTRRSAKDFRHVPPDELPATATAAVMDYCGDPEVRGAGQVVPLAAARPAWRGGAAVSPESLCQICQSQALVGRACAAFLFTGPRLVHLTGAFDHGEFLRACLLSGMVSAELYRLAASVGLASTMIGGFFDSMMIDTCEPARYPLALHVFGQRGDGGSRKADAALTVTNA